MVTDNKAMQSVVDAIDERLTTVENGLKALEMRLKTISALGDQFFDLKQKLSDMRIEYTDLYTKTQQDMASVRGSIAVNTRENRKLNLPEPAFALIDLEEEAKLKAMGWSDKQIKNWAVQKAQIDQYTRLLSPAGSHQESAKKEGNDTLKTSSTTKKK